MSIINDYAGVIVYFVLVITGAIMLSMIIHQHREINKLDRELKKYINLQNIQYNALRAYNDGTSKAFTDLLESVTTLIDEYHSEIQQNAKKIQDAQGDISALVKCVDKLRYKLKVMSTYELPTPVSSNSVSYAWGYPDKEGGSSIVTGGLYLVIGYVYKTDETVKSYNAEWDGRRFVITDDGPDHAQYFDKVYAYIRMPDPSDIMTEVIKAIEKEKE